MSLKSFAQSAMVKVGAVFKRFPVSVICCAIFTLLCIAEVHYDHILNLRDYLWTFWLFGIGAVLSLALDNWRESCENKKLTTGVSIGAYLIHIIITIILYNLKSISITSTLALVSIATAIVLALYCLPYLKKKNDMPFWHFSFQSGIAVGIALTFTATLCGGLEFILFAFNELFRIHLSEKLFVDIFFLNAFFVFPVLFMAYIPTGADKCLETLPPGKKIGDKLVHYVIIPLLFVYLFVLYLYIISIVVHWELPNGKISWLVSAAMAVVLLLVFRLYPAGVSEESSFEKKLLKILPFLMLPLLILMSVGIVRRISDYGWTVLRAYLLLFNLWCYAVCFYVIKTRAHRIIWIPVSFGLLFLVVSVLPINLSYGVERWMHHQVASVVENAGITKLPMNEDEYHNWRNSLDENDRENTSSRLIYMQKMYDRSSYADLVEPDVNLWFWDAKAGADVSMPNPFDEAYLRMNYKGVYTGAIQCSSMMNLEYDDMVDVTVNQKTGAISFGTPSDRGIPSYHFTIERKLIDDNQSEDNQAAFVKVSTEPADLYIDMLSLRYINISTQRHELSISGVLCIH